MNLHCLQTHSDPPVWVTQSSGPAASWLGQVHSSISLPSTELPQAPGGRGRAPPPPPLQPSSEQSTTCSIQQAAQVLFLLVLNCDFVVPFASLILSYGLRLVCRLGEVLTYCMLFLALTNGSAKEQSQLERGKNFPCQALSPQASSHQHIVPVVLAMSRLQIAAAPIHKLKVEHVSHIEL